MPGAVSLADSVEHPLDQLDNLLLAGCGGRELAPHLREATVHCLEPFVHCTEPFVHPAVQVGEVLSEGVEASRCRAPKVRDLTPDGSEFRGGLSPDSGKLRGGLSPDSRKLSCDSGECTGGLTSKVRHLDPETPQLRAEVPDVAFTPTSKDASGGRIVGVHPHPSIKITNLLLNRTKATFEIPLVHEASISANEPQRRRPGKLSTGFAATPAAHRRSAPYGTR